jgi:prepilin-type N-terminal cleavage/methylation domain-containing protein
MSTAPRTSQSGFTLIELLVAMGVMLLVLAGTTEIMTSAVNSSTTAKQTLDMNAHLRAAIDLVQRDMLQVGQGMPVGRRIGVPTGTGAQPILRPGPGISGDCPGVQPFPDEGSIPAVSVGPELGPPINDVCTDVITVLAADNVVEPMALSAIAANGSTATVHNLFDISDDPDADGDNIRAGDLLMIEKGTDTVLVQVTAVTDNTLTFGTGTGVDPLRLNQRDPTLAMDGTINQLKAAAPATPDAPVVVAGVEQATTATITRIRMLTYFVDTDIDPMVPRLMRGVGGRVPTAVAMGVDAFRVSYDIADQDTNPTDVRMTAADLDGSSGSATRSAPRTRFAR